MKRCLRRMEGQSTRSFRRNTASAPRVSWAAMAMGLIKGEGFAVDASVMEANASRYHGKAPEDLA